MYLLPLHKLLSISVGAALLVFGGACSHVKITRTHDVNADTEYDVKHGFPVYPPKPYLLVARAGEGGKVISVTTVMFPDTANPHYIRQAGMFGKLNYSYSVENGMLKTFGSDADSKTAEALAQVAGGMTGYGAMAKSLADAAKVGVETDNIKKQAASQAEVDAARAAIISAKTKLETIKGNAGLGATSQQTAAIVDAIGTLDSLAGQLNAPVATILTPVQQAIAKQLTAVAKALDEAKANGASKFVDQINRPISEIKTASGTIAGTPPDKPSFDLYQINIDPQTGATNLVKVDLP